VRAPPQQPVASFNPFAQLAAQQSAAMVNPFVQIAAPQPHFGGHRRMTSCGIEAKMDFGEASFLQPRQDVEMDWS